MLRKCMITFVLCALSLCVTTTAFAASVDRGAKGDQVQYVQNLLVTQGYLTSSADGIFGNDTEYAVRVFQKEKGLDVDGRVGPATLAALEKNAEKFASYKSDIINHEGVPFKYSKIIDMGASAYSSQDPGNSKYTASGNLLKHGYVSVDPDVIALGTKLYIEGYGYAVADDIGGTIQGNRIDLAMDTRAEALQFGRKSVKVYILK